MLRAKVKHLDAIVFTHEHKDHVAGMDDIRAFNYKQQGPVDIMPMNVCRKPCAASFLIFLMNKGYPGIPQIIYIPYGLNLLILAICILPLLR
jgi:phosphoribosyl 1,2-cyclic phosphate phosphodiesterase